MTVIAKARVNAPIKQVHQALTDAAQLRMWLAEHAEVDLPGRYQFWGRYTPEGDAPHQRPIRADDTGVAFTWHLDGVDTTTDITLEAEGDDSTIVAVDQSHFDFADVMSGNIRGVLQTFWALAIANLADHLEGRALTPKVDFTSADLRAEFEVGAPAERVFASLTDSAQASEWFGFPVGIEPWEGGRFAMGGLDNNPSPAKILELVPDTRLSVDWGPGGVGTWELAGSGGRTRITLVQSGFDTANPPYAAWGGVLSGVAGLRRFHEHPGRPQIFLPA
ncbi:SRPBCC domain-containing protein [Asanoa sp. WMMD1127]|uniref:SRPBCC family protein n=1 Tax=Asanoa sp. WMMD1127 TaxID=3016107 RepID=UPI002417E45A|nr:SRPBCC domain-containing protein [Asanoa sp. WMMD1127]MDG4823169.1 SRPBCC domain-containing protein [Asanoa sp. WMMD1127]